MRKPINENNIKVLFGLKIKSYRTGLGLSLQDLSKKTDTAVSYLSEIESGKKYPKPEKLIRLAEALGVDYDTLVSTRVERNLDPFAALINSELLQQFPFHLFGISAGDILGLFKNNPKNANAFLQTFLQISRAYDMSLENFLFAALRTYIRQQRNYFHELEELAQNFCIRIGAVDELLSYQELRYVLEERYGYTIDEDELTDHPELNNLRSVLRYERTLALNGRLSRSQKAFILARELGFLELQIKERPLTSSWIKVQSFDQLVNNFKASYFGGALLLPQKQLKNDILNLFKQDTWDDCMFQELLQIYNATPEMLLYRLSQLLPGLMNIEDVFYFRFVTTSDPSTIQLTKELNMTDMLISYGLGINEHHCRRMIPIQLLQKLRGAKVHLATGVQNIEFVQTGQRFLLLSMARPLSLSEGRSSAIALGIKIDNSSRAFIRCIDDPDIDYVKVSESCERCPLTDCSDRVVEASYIAKYNTIEKREHALQDFRTEAE